MAKSTSETVDCRKSLTTGLTRLFNDETTSDITLVVGSKKYAVHKNFLAASSEYFYRMFYVSQWKESTQTEIVLEETAECEAVFDTFIQYFYTGTIELCPETAASILTLADKYAATVKQNCVAFMMKTINSGNLDKALAWVPICNQLKVVDVLERCYVIICFNFEKATKLPGWSSLPLHNISVILQRRDITIPSEYDVFLIVQDLIMSQAKGQTETINDLLSNVEFKNMTAVELGQVEQSELATKKASGILNQHVNEAFRYLAFKAEHRESGKANISRIYTKGKTMDGVKFHTLDDSGNMTPFYRNKRTITRRYQWKLWCSQTQPDEISFHVRVPEVKVEETVNVRELVNPNNCSVGFQQSRHGIRPRPGRYTPGPVIKTNTYELAKDIEGTVQFNIMMFLTNSQGNIMSVITKTFSNIQMPTEDNQEIVRISVKGIHTTPHGCLISCDIF